MAIEIERKYLVLNGTGFLKGIKGARILQGYLHEKGPTTRVRRVSNRQGFLTVKGPRKGLGRPEYEYPIPLQDANELLVLCEDRLLTKTRHDVLVGNHVWHVDVFTGVHKGLVTAEIELQYETEPFTLPTWIGPEVTFEKAYTNKRLALARCVPLRRVA